MMLSSFPGEHRETIVASLTLIYAARSVPFDQTCGLCMIVLDAESERMKQVTAEPDLCFPIYGDLLVPATGGMESDARWMPRTHDGQKHHRRKDK